MDKTEASRILYSAINDLISVTNKIVNDNNKLDDKIIIEVNGAKVFIFNDGNIGYKPNNTGVHKNEYSVPESMQITLDGYGEPCECCNGLGTVL